MPASFSRRAVLLGLGASGLAAGAPGRAAAQNAYANLEGTPWFYLTDAEARFLAAAGDVLIPEDDYPSASQVGVVDFIDLQLASPWGKGDGLYLKGPFPDGATNSQGYQMPYTPAELFRTAISRIEEAEGTALADLDAAGREDLITRLSEGEMDLGEDIGAAAFFQELHSIVNEGFFADPIYGGNKDYAAWDMIGFPGAHAYYLSFVDQNVPYEKPPMGIAHIPGTRRSASLGASAGAARPANRTEEG
ncbi:gluconate 2-dehydrogenase subunit 3 family protein [Histidinibacterium aquaticum]|uniref:Gluconate 2-dehydrogenase subunit 3 family protein n=1 Tax=Histidinibacterium aquaticum TaxID=2613962 RepID=A0A5J5GFJ2_9RHOB|nr:gluconate 2-dehydrogenase subunit 3 family protein [Histidinibacterium aquaticum]KAA9006945.1 gluconate 2-dehydrogenase subunit 3 family protein [Histidinibacterium aquaticum]